jgi:hypothetical protein
MAAKDYEVPNWRLALVTAVRATAAVEGDRVGEGGHNVRFVVCPSIHVSRRDGSEVR